MLRRCFELHTGPLLQILRPTVVLASGNKTHSFSGNIAAKSPRTRVIRMMHYAHREGRAGNRRRAIMSVALRTLVELEFFFRPIARSKMIVLGSSRKQGIP